MMLCMYVTEKYKFLFDVKELSLALTEGHRESVFGGGGSNVRL
jgi:hypothetical protein